MRVVDLLCSCAASGAWLECMATIPAHAESIVYAIKAILHYHQVPCSLTRDSEERKKLKLKDIQDNGQDIQDDENYVF